MLSSDLEIARFSDVFDSLERLVVLVEHVQSINLETADRQLHYLEVHVYGGVRVFTLGSSWQGALRSEK